MRIDDRFDELVESLGGFYRVWLIYIGLELGYFGRIHEAGAAGITIAGLASATVTDPGAAGVWAAAADAHDLVDLRGDRLLADEEVSSVLLDDARPEYLGGQLLHAVVASLDWDRMLDFFRTGRPQAHRPDRYREAIQRLTAQDIAIFFEDVLGALPQLVAELSAGGRVLDIHCGGGLWLIAMARRFPAIDLIGVESEADSVERAGRNVREAGLEGRIRIARADVLDPPTAGDVDLVYYQYALHQLSDPARSLRGAWAALRPGGRIVVLDWPLPSTADDYRTAHGGLIAAAQLNEAFGGTSLATRETYLAWFAEAGLPVPQVIDLPAGGAFFTAVRPA